MHRLNRVVLLSFVLAIPVVAAEATPDAGAPNARLITGACSPSDRPTQGQSVLQITPACTGDPCFFFSLQIETGVVSQCRRNGTKPDHCISGTGTVSFDLLPVPTSGEVTGEATLTFGKAKASKQRFRALIHRQRCG